MCIRDSYGRGLPRGTSSERVEHRLDVAKTRRLRQLASGVGALSAELGLFQIFATLLFAYQARVSGESSLTLGAPAHLRTRSREKTVAGLLTEVFPLRVELDPGGETFTSLLAKVRSSVLTYLRHAVPGASRAAGSRSFAAVLNVIHADFGDFSGYPVTARWLHPGHHDREHPLRLHVHSFGGGSETGELTLLFDLNLETVNRRAISHVLRLLDALLEDPDQAINAVPLLGDDERHRLLESADGGAPSRQPSSVVQAIEAQARRTPDAVAVRVGGDGSGGDMTPEVITFAELDRRAGDLGAALSEAVPAGENGAVLNGAVLNGDVQDGAGPNGAGLSRARIAYLAERSPQAVVAMLGLW